MSVRLIASAVLASFSCLLINASGCARSSHGQEKALLDLERQWLESEDDPSALESILADDFVHVLPFGFVTKAEQLKYMRTHPVPEGGNDRHFEDLRVRIFGSAGIVNGIVVATMPDGKVQKTIFTDVFARRNGRWQAVNAQESPSFPRNSE